MTRLSVIVPCYNVSPFLATTLTSLRRNTAPGVEFVLVDDASTDGTAALLAAELERLPGARLVTHQHNAGLASARNSGLDVARGTYLTFLDGDDWMAPGYLAELSAVIERLGCAMVRTDHVQVTGRARAVHRIGYGPRGVVRSPRTGIVPTSRPTSVDAAWAWAGIYHRSLLDRGLLHFPDGLRTCEDRPWIWRLHLQAESFAVVGLTGVFYRRAVASSLTQVADERQLDFVRAFEEVFALVQADRDADRLMPKAMRSYCAIVAHHLSRRDLYPAALQQQLARICRHSLRRLPQAPLREVYATLGKERQDLLAEVVAA
jgi:glycosyltransferase involved in cell wall biosynthesis